MDSLGWIGVDLDATLAHYDGWKGAGHIGDPVPAMQERVNRWLAQGIEVRIFTARACAWELCQDRREKARLYKEIIEPIVEWGKRHFDGHVFRVTCMKDFGMLELYDDRCVTVEANTGRYLVPERRISNGQDHEDDQPDVEFELRAEGGMVHIRFAKPVEWLAMPPEQAVQFANGLIFRIKDARLQRE